MVRILALRSDSVDRHDVGEISDHERRVGDDMPYDKEAPVKEDDSGVLRFLWVFGFFIYGMGVNLGWW